MQYIGVYLLRNFQEAVKAMPTSFGALAKLVRPRLSPRGCVAEMSANDQQELVWICRIVHVHPNVHYQSSTEKHNISFNQ